jgi:hypothetical protein
MRKKRKELLKNKENYTIKGVYPVRTLCPSNGVKIGKGFQIATIHHQYHLEEHLRMKAFEIKNKAIHSERGEYLLGFRETGSHACYMVYGVLKPNEKARSIKPGTGHEEIVLALEGNLEVKGFYSGSLKEGSAFHLRGNQECLLENSGEADAVYIIAGGHSEMGRH